MRVRFGWPVFRVERDEVVLTETDTHRLIDGLVDKCERFGLTELRDVVGASVVDTLLVAEGVLKVEDFAR